MKNSGKAQQSDAVNALEASQGLEIPPAGIKIMRALRLLLREKDFNSITTAEIARVAGANEALLYRYFTDKRGLLHHVLAEYLRDYLLKVQGDVHRVRGAVDRLRRLIQSSISFYEQNRVFAKILLVEVRNWPGYFESEAYRLVQEYARLITEIIKDGVNDKEIRDDIPVSCLRDIILGAIEHACLGRVIFDRKFDAESLAKHVSAAVLTGLARTGD